MISSHTYCPKAIRGQKARSGGVKGKGWGSGYALRHLGEIRRPLLLAMGRRRCLWLGEEISCKLCFFSSIWYNGRRYNKQITYYRLWMILKLKLKFTNNINIATEIDEQRSDSDSETEWCIMYNVLLISKKLKTYQLSEIIYIIYHWFVLFFFKYAT